MKIKYTLKIMYGDDEIEIDNKFITKDKNKIIFLNYFVSHFDKISHLNGFCYMDLEGDKCIKLVNKLISEFNKLISNDDSLSEYISYNQVTNCIEARDTLFDILDCIEDIFEWSFYSSKLHCYGQYIYHEREDISNRKSMTKKEIETILGYEIEILN